MPQRRTRRAAAHGFETADSILLQARVSAGSCADSDAGGDSDSDANSETHGSVR